MVVRESIEPLLEEYWPLGISSLKFTKLSLGTVAPKIEGYFSIYKEVVTFDICKNMILCLVEEFYSLPKPCIDYTLKAIGGILTAILGLVDMIDDTVESIMTDTLEWPHRIVVPIGGIPVDTREIDSDYCESPKNMEMIGKSDPYVVLHVRPLFKVKTKVFDEDIGQDKKLGTTKLPLVDLEEEKEKVIELRLFPSLHMTRVKDKKDRGTITMKVLYHAFNKEEQHAVLEAEKRILEDRKNLKDAKVIESTVEVIDGATSVVVSGVGAVDSGIGAGLGVGVGNVGTGLGAVGSGLSKASRFMGRTITGHSGGSKRGGSSTPVNLVQENGGMKPLQ
ncbi:hypothetical protein Ancab_029116 [Ancistrocladus abbreviatus]